MGRFSLYRNSHYLLRPMLMESGVKFCRLQNLSGASEQKGVDAICKNCSPVKFKYKRARCNAGFDHRYNTEVIYSCSNWASYSGGKEDMVWGRKQRHKPLRTEIY